jgi:mono/diheme cytochrome c family protein
MKRITLLIPLALACLGLAAWSQQPTTETAPKKTIEKVPMKATAANSGEEMYKEYCAACHGKEGKGDGPAASALKVPPPDLTILAKNNKGNYPADHVSSVLRFGL